MADLYPNQKRHLERFFPGLIEAVQRLAPGEFIPKMPQLKSAGAGLRTVIVSLFYRLEDGNRVEITISSRIKSGYPPYRPSDPIDPAQWERFHYSLNYGPSPRPCVFRFDLDDISGHHVHMRPDPDDHIPAETVEPDVRNLDPFRFIEMVAAYRANKTYPVRKKGT